jgi:hypothetical protein
MTPQMERSRSGSATATDIFERDAASRLPAILYSLAITQCPKLNTQGTLPAFNVQEMETAKINRPATKSVGFTLILREPSSQCSRR